MRILLALLLLLAAAVAQAQAPDPALEATLRDPWVPPAIRKSAKALPTQGASLQAQVEQKLRADFDRADTKRSGAITQSQASAAGLGFIAQHFDAIDARRTGAITFADFKAFLRERGAKLD